MKNTPVLLVASLLSLSSAALSAATINHTFDRTTVYSSIEMKRTFSTGESLAGLEYPGVSPFGSVAGDILVEIMWQDDTTLSEIWGINSGKDTNLTTSVLFPDSQAPGVSFDSQDLSNPTNLINYRAVVEQSGNTGIADPWEIRNFGDVAISQVIFSARGTPDMGFDTDSGTNPGNGGAGFTLFLDDTLSQWDGTLDVHYDWFNDWNNTTDMFHRMTLTFDSNSLLTSNQSIVYYQDTDELYVPEPGTLALFGLGLAGLGFLRRRSALS